MHECAFRKKTWAMGADEVKNPRNAVSGEVKRITSKELFDMFDESVHEALKKNAAGEGVEYMVVYQNLELSPRTGGQLAALIVGPNCTSKTLEEAASRRLGSLPSNFQYPVAWIPAKEIT